MLDPVAYDLRDRPPLPCWGGSGMIRARGLRRDTPPASGFTTQWCVGIVGKYDRCPRHEATVPHHLEAVREDGKPVWQ